MRCYVPPHAWTGPRLELDAAESHYLLHVLRRGVGDLLDLFDGRGRIASALLADTRGGRACVEIRTETRHPPLAPRIELIQAVPKGKRMDLILEKATELGVSVLRPVWTERTIVKVEEARSDRKLDRWRDIVLSAARQCGTAWIPEMRPPCSWGDLLAARGQLPAFLILGDLEPGAQGLRECLAEARDRAVEALGLLIGPEGDFTPAEKAAIRALGACSVNLGPTVLRTETAALFAIGAVRYQWL